MYIVIGANGFFGSYIVKSILELTSEFVIATSRSVKEKESNGRIKWIYCDVLNDASVDKLIDEIHNNRNLKIIYLAAFHNPALVEQNRSLAWNINVTAFSNFINKSSFVDELYYVSTDSVYGNGKSCYRFTEDDKLNPINYYGHCKCAAEGLAIHQSRNVVRCPFLIAPSITNKYHFYDQIVGKLSIGDSVEMLSDSYRSSIGFNIASDLLIELIEIGNSYQIVNIGGDQALSKYEIGIEIAKREGLDTDLIRPVLTSESKFWNVVPRATNTLMDNSLLKQILNLKYIDLFNQPVKE